MIIIIDNYDSFTYNLYQYVKEFTDDVKVIKNDNLSLLAMNEEHIKAIILSPGPGKPINAGLMPKVIKKYYKKLPILGICLGHQAIIEFFGGDIINAKDVCHGKVYEVEHYSNCIIFENIDSKFMATRYHSLAGSEQLPDCLEITARTIKDKEIMGVKHIEYKIYGLQFHPESIETVHGLKMIENFINGI